MLRVSRDRGETALSILDTVLVDERQRAAVLSLALREAQRWSADRVECGEEFEALLRSSSVLRRLTRHAQRGCLLLRRRDGRLVVGDQAGLKIGICDGDVPFA